MMKIKKLSGSYTIEAALIFPIIFFSILAVIYLAVYLHDTTVLKGIVDEVASKSSVCSIHQTYLESNEFLSYEERLEKGLYWRFNGTSINSIIPIIKKLIYEKAKKSLIMSDTKDLKIHVDIKNHIIHKEIIINVSKPFNTSILPVSKMMSYDRLMLNVSSMVVVKEPTEVIRVMNFLDVTSDKIKGVQDIKTRYEQKAQDIVTLLNGSKK